MQLPGDRVRLREFGGEDAADFESYHTDPRFLRFYGPEARDREHLRSLVERFISWAGEEPRRNYQLAIADSTTGQLIGCCGLRTAGLPEKCADFGLELSVDRWGRGLGTEASRLLLAFGFGSLGLEEVRATAVTENTRVARLVEDLRFSEAGRRRGDDWMDEKGWTLTDWSLTREVWLRARLDAGALPE
jgi:ribosomal-protein-alanine N-acetyltransferase